MADIETTAKNNGPLAGVVGLVVLVAGTGIWSESGEEEQIEQMAEELHQADIIQNERHDELLEKFYEMDKQLALLKQQVESQ